MLGVRNSSSISAIGGGGHCEQCSTEIILPLPSSSPGEVTTHCCSSTECGGGQAAATKGGGGGGLSVVQEARCFHPHHIGGGDPTRSKVHVCLQRCNTFASSPHFPPILLSPVVELEDYCGGGGSQYKNGVLTHHHHPKEQQQQQQQQTPR